MIYILLILITVGVLLMSPEGKSILQIIEGLGIIAFWIALIIIAIIIGIIFFNTDTGQSFGKWILILLESGLFLALLYHYGNNLIKILKNKEKRAEILKKIKNSPNYIWKHHKGWAIVIIACLVFCILIIWASQTP